MIFVTLIVVAMQGVFAQTQYLTDPDFEASSAGLTPFVTTSNGTVNATKAKQWQLTFVGGPSAGTSSIVTDTKYAGNKALAITITKQSNRNDIKLFQVLPATPTVTPGKYILTYYMKADKADYPVGVDILKSTQGSTTNGASPFTVAHNTTTNWKKYRFVFDLSTWTTAELTNMRISLRPNSAGSPPQGVYPKTFWFDNFSLTPYDDATANIGTLNDLKDIALLVAQERQKMLLDSGFTADAQALQIEINKMKVGSFSVPVVPLKAIGFNPAPTYTDISTNPYLKSIIKWADTYASATFKPLGKAKQGARLFLPNEFDRVRGLTADMERLYWLVTSPVSTYRYNPELYYRFLHHVYATTDEYSLNGSDGQGVVMNDWFSSAIFPYAWRMAEYSYADYIPPAFKKQMREATQLLGTQHRKWAASIEKYDYVNRDISYAEALTHAGLYLENQEWVSYAKRIIDTTKANLYPDGAYAYIGFQNEVQNYHGATNNSMAKLWSVLEYQPAWDCLKQSSNYEVISIEGGNVPEFYTAPVWKTQWNGIAGASGYPLVAVSENPYLKTRFEQLYPREVPPNPSGISFYKPIVGKPIADNYVVYDRNIQGPRGRYGTFSYGITARNTSPIKGMGVLSVGMQTMVGAMTIDTFSNNQKSQLNAALMAVHSKVHIQNKYNAEWRDWAYMSTQVTPKVCVSRTASAVSTPSVLQSQNAGPSSIESNWASYQHWITLPDRVIGFVETYPKDGKATQAFEVEGRVKLTYGRGGVLSPKQLIINSSGKKYSYGKLSVIVHEHDFTKVDTASGGVLRDWPKTASEIIFRYNLSDGKTLHTYPATTKKYFVVEIRRADAQGDAVVKRVIDDNVKGIVVKLNGKSYSSFRNLGTNNYTLNLSDVLIANATHDIHYPRNDQPSDSKTIPSSTQNITLSAGNQVLIVSTTDKKEIGNDWKNYDQTLQAVGDFSANIATNVTLPIKAYLQGAMLTKPNQKGYSRLMRDDLRTKKLIPTTDPYRGRTGYTHVANATTQTITNANVLTTTGNDAIVDWVFVELRAKTDITKVLATKSGLIQRDGDVVSTDGFSSLVFNVPVDYYYITLRHRNHLGITTKAAVLLNETTTAIDFTKTTTLAYGTEPLVSLSSTVNALWAGDANNDGKVVSSGTDTEINTLSKQILQKLINPNFSVSYLLNSYNDSDIDLNGTTAVTGTQSDVFLISLNVLNHPSNRNFSVSYVIQIPLQKTAVTTDLAAERMLLYQRANGGWRNGKGLSVYNTSISDSQANVIKAQKSKLDAYMDNNSTTSEIEYLVKSFKQTNNQKYIEAAQNGILYLFNAQYDNGGWPQSYPDSSSYHKHITYNDWTMVHILDVMKAITEGTNGFEMVERTIIEKARTSLEKGIECILKTQYKQNGVPTVWCGQHDRKTLLPAKARAFELPSLSGAETTGIVAFLMSINNPTPQIKHAIKSAVAWLNSNKIVGIALKTITDASQPSGKDLIVISDPNSTLWARFYDLKTNKPFFTGRDSVPKATLVEIPNERRVGYDYYGKWPQNLISKQYPDWLKRWGN